MGAGFGMLLYFGAYGLPMSAVYGLLIATFVAHLVDNIAIAPVVLSTMWTASANGCSRFGDWRGNIGDLRSFDRDSDRGKPEGDRPGNLCKLPDASSA